MSEQRKVDRRGGDRRQRQWSEADGWDGIERRKARDRRKGDRRVKHMSPPGKRERDMERREKERRISDRKREGHKRKEQDKY